MLKTYYMQLDALLWKHRLVRCHCFVMTFLELAVPLSIILLLRIAYARYSKISHNEVSFIQNTESIADYYLYQHNSIKNLYYSPNESDFVRSLMEDVSDRLNLNQKSMAGFENENTLFQMKGKSLKLDQDSLAVIFETTQDIDRKINYTIRNVKPYPTSRFIPSEIVPGPHENYGEMYFTFVTLQLAIDTSFIEKISKTNLTKHLKIQPYPYPPYVKDDFSILKYDYLLPVFITNCFLFLFLVDVSRILTEKASGMKELMKMMGVPKNLLWVSYYINSMVIYLLTVMELVSVLQTSDNPLIPKTNMIMLGISLLLIANYVILLSYAATTFFSKSLHACIATSALWFVFQLLSGYLYVVLRSRTLSAVLSGIPNILIFWMFKIIGIYEMKDVGLQWHNLFSTPSLDVSISVGFIWFLLTFQIIALVFVIWYTDQVNPGVYGVAKPMLFLFQRDYWRTQVDPLINMEDKEEQNPDYFEPYSGETNAGITIDNVTKVYTSWTRSDVHALSGISLNVYKGGITALLGHNGAGKTTLMSIITGMISLTKGSVKVNGIDTKKNMDEIRLSIGVCPQHNMTFSNLTVKEHLIFFSKIKGISHAIATKESDAILSSVNLSDKASKVCSQLSCGMKRRAQLAMALVGKPSVLILDEPTSGLDPESRRELWDILLSFKKCHTILMSTHSLEEADMLADRVLIMSHGRLKCCGTSMFLKKAYGTGYKLYLVFKSKKDVDIMFTNVEDSVKDLSVTCSRNNNKIVLHIPEESKKHFQSIFSFTEQNKERWGINTIGLSSTTLEDVFLRVTSDAETVDKSEPIESDQTSRIEMCLIGKQPVENSTLKLMKNRVEGLAEKKLIHTKISRHIFLLQILFAIQFSCTFIFFSNDSKLYDDNPKLGLDLSAYNDKITHVLYSNNGSGQKDFSRFRETFQQVEDAYTGVLEEGRKSIKSYSENIPIALNFTNDSYTGLYSTSLYHALPIAVNTLTNLLAAEMNLDGNGTQVISVNNYPIKVDTLEKFNEEKEVKSFMSIMLWAGCLTIGAFILQAIFMPLPINERKSSSRRLQQMTGTPPYLYWLIVILYDGTICFIISNCVILLVCLFDPDGTFSFQTYPPLFVHLSFDIVAGLSFTYMLSLLVKNSATGYIIFLIIVLFSTLISLIIFIEETSTTSISGTSHLRNLFRLQPSFCFNYGLLKIGIIASKNAVCLREFKSTDGQYLPEDLCCDKDEVTKACTGLRSYYFDTEYGIFDELISFAFSTLFSMVILMMNEYKIFQNLISICAKCIYRPVRHPFQDDGDDDDDVQNEKKRLANHKFPTGSMALGIDNLTKQYMIGFKNDHIIAVKGVTIGINKGECFGLLGVNGAGKTTIFKMLVGEEIPTKGSIKGYSSGYCPEFDAIDKFLTGRQVLTLFCRLRGMSKEDTKEEVNNMLKMTGLTIYADKQNGTYSGGNRRKLSVAIALIGNSKGVVLLDEPTSGVDPFSRKILHQALSIARKQGTSIIISSHSMDECEKLCDRLAIMCNGRLACIGNVQHLKKKFGSGVSLTVKLKVAPSEPETSSSIDEVDDIPPEIDSELASEMAALNRPVSSLKSSIKNAFDCELKDENKTILQFHIKNNNGYTELFSKMERIKCENPDLLEDYMINDTSLEDVFMYIARDGATASSSNTGNDTIA